LATPILYVLGGVLLTGAAFLAYNYWRAGRPVPPVGNRGPCPSPCPQPKPYPPSDLPRMGIILPPQPGEEEEIGRIMHDVIAYQPHFLRR
jgi:hypothetical protein